jgi:hypothetical protein
MLAIHDQHDQFTHQMRNRLRTTGMGLGLVRLLLDAGLTDEARATLSSLEHGFQGIAKAADKPSQKPANRLKGVSRGGSVVPLRAKLAFVQSSN